MIEMRRATRHDGDHTLIGEHRLLGEIPLHIVNISDRGFMMQGPAPIERGERIVIQLPVIGRIEAHLVWSHQNRAGFQLERVVRSDDFAELVTHLVTKSRGRRLRRPF